MLWGAHRMKIVLEFSVTTKRKSPTNRNIKVCGKVLEGFCST